MRLESVFAKCGLCEAHVEGSLSSNYVNGYKNTSCITEATKPNSYLVLFFKLILIDIELLIVFQLLQIALITFKLSFTLFFNCGCSS